MKPIRVAVAGCGSVSSPYLANLRHSAYAEVVGVCDVVTARAQAQAERFAIPHYFSTIDAMLTAVEFDLLVNLTAMPEHYPINLKALEAGKHVLSEKPLAGTREQGKYLLETATAKGVRLYGAPNAVTSPAFACLAEIVLSGRIGRVFAASGCYGHAGPGWGPWFYKKGGGSLFDLGVYNITTLTGLLGPVRSLVALSGTAISERTIEGETVVVEADDNTMLLLDHGNTVFSHISTGFVYGKHREDSTLNLMGTQGSAYLLGWDWEPHGVEVWTNQHDTPELLCVEQGDYRWESGAAAVAESLATGKELRMTPEHAYHVLEVMLTAQEAASTGQRLPVESTFPYPLIPVVPHMVQAAQQTGLDAANHRR